MPDRLVTVTCEDHIAVVVIDNPPVNPLNNDVLTELREIFAGLEQKEDVRAVIITGAGNKAFVAGADIKEFPTWTPEMSEDFTERGQRLFTRIENFPAPVIAAIGGFALGGGLELALSCDIRIASEKAKMGLPEVSLGIIPGYGGTQRLCRTIPVGEAKKMIYTAEHINAEKALAIGLVQQVVPQSELLETAKALANKIASNGPVAVRIAKQAVNSERNASMPHGLAAELAGSKAVFQTKDKQEGVDAFIHKRTPNWQNC